MYKNSNHTKPILCSHCLTNINPGDLYYLDRKTNYCLACREKQIKLPVKYSKTLSHLPAIGSKQWQNALNKALTHKSFRLTPCKNIFQVIADHATARYFGATLRRSGTQKAQEYLIKLVKQGKIQCP